MPLVIIFFIVPLVELAIFGMVAGEIGIFSALLFALVTAIIGGNVVRIQGLQTLSAMKTSVDAGQIPLNEIFDGFCLVAAGALLITPGFLTDAIGFALLVPRLRDIARSFIKEHTNWAAGGTTSGAQYYSRDGDIIDGEYEQVQEDDKKIT